MILEKVKSDDYRDIKRLYKTAFPADERAPFCLLEKRARSGDAELYAAKEEGKFIGFAYLVCLENAAYLFYFAIVSDMRGKGYGSAILKELSEIYSGKSLFLAREQLVESAENYEQRVRRHEFYLRSGFRDTSLKIQEAAVVYDVMCIGDDVAPAVYEEMMRRWSGRIFSRLVKMKMFS